MPLQIAPSLGALGGYNFRIVLWVPPLSHLQLVHWVACFLLLFNSAWNRDVLSLLSDLHFVASSVIRRWGTAWMCYDYVQEVSPAYLLLVFLARTLRSDTVNVIDLFGLLALVTTSLPNMTPVPSLARKPSGLRRGCSSLQLWLYTACLLFALSLVLDALCSVLPLNFNTLVRSKVLLSIHLSLLTSAFVGAWLEPPGLQHRQETLSESSLVTEGQATHQEDSDGESAVTNLDHFSFPAGPPMAKTQSLPVLSGSRMDDHPAMDEIRQGRYLRSQSLTRRLHRRISQLANVSTSASAAFHIGKNGERTRRKVSARFGTLLGQGAFGSVKICLDEKTGELLAAKIIECDPQAPNIRLKLQQLETEVMIMKKLVHPSLVCYIGSQKLSPTSFCIYMEYVPGGSIASLLEAFGSFTDDLAARYTVEALDGVVYLHENHIIHRDIKGANILLSTNGNAKLADFGSAKLLADLSCTASGCYGTILWMAPEVFQEKEYGYAVDMWSLGATVMEMLTANRPWHLAGLNGISLMALLSKGEVELPWGAYQEACSPRALHFMMQCMTIDPDERPKATDLYHDPFLSSTASLATVSTLQAFYDAWMYFLEDTDHDHRLQQSFDQYCLGVLQHEISYSPTGAAWSGSPTNSLGSSLGHVSLFNRPATLPPPRNRVETIAELEARTASIGIKPEWQNYLARKDSVARSSLSDVAMDLIHARRSFNVWSAKLRHRHECDSAPSDPVQGTAEE